MTEALLMILCFFSGIVLQWQFSKKQIAGVRQELEDSKEGLRRAEQTIEEAMEVIEYMRRARENGL